MEHSKEVLPMGLDEIYANTLMESGEIINELSNYLNEDVDFEPGDRIEVIGGAGIQSGDTGKVVKISGNKVYYRSDKNGETDYMFKGYLKNISTGQSGRLASDEEIESSYDDFKIRQFEWNDSNKKTSGFIDIEFPYGEDKVDNFIIYPNGKIAFDNWYPENVSSELKKYINNQKMNKEEISESSVNNHSKAFYSQMYDWVKNNEDALDFMKKEFVDAYRNSTNKNEYMNNLLKSGALSKTDKEIEDENKNYGKIRESIEKKKSQKSPLKEGFHYDSAFEKQARGNFIEVYNKDTEELLFTFEKFNSGVWIGSDYAFKSKDKRAKNISDSYKISDEWSSDDLNGFLNILKRKSWLNVVGKLSESQKSPLKESVTAYNGIYLSVIPERGGLKLSLTESGKEFAEENGLSEINFWEIFDDVEGNSDYHYIANLGNAGFGLTEAPGIVYGYEIDDDGELIETPDSELFVYDNYMIDDFGVKLAKNGSVIFHGEPKRNKIDEKETKERFKNLIKYRVTVKHDKGRTRFIVPASSEEKAKKRVMDNENCPECAIVKVERITESLDEKSDPLYKNHKGLYKTSINGFKVFEYNGKFIVYFNVGKKEHAFNWNGGSRSWEYLKNKLENITPEQALSDKELM